MKPLLPVLLLALGFLPPAPVPSARAAEPAPAKTSSIEKRLAEIQAATGAADEQLAKIRLVLEDESAKKAALKSKPGDERKTAKKELRAATQAAINTILTEEQRARLGAAKAAKKEAKRKKQNPGSGAAGKEKESASAAAQSCGSCQSGSSR